MLLDNVILIGNCLSSCTIPGDSLNVTCNSWGGGIYENRLRVICGVHY